MPKLIVIARELRYAGKTHAKGEEFEASDKHAKLLKAVKKAEDAHKKVRPIRAIATVAPRKRNYATRHLTAED